MIEQLLAQASIKSVALAAVVVFVLVRVVRWIDIEIRIRKLGGHARRAKTWLPYGQFTCGDDDNIVVDMTLTPFVDLDFVARAVHGTMHHKNLEVWLKWFMKSNGEFDYTLVSSGVRE